LSAKPPVKPALKTPSSSLAFMSKRRMSRTSPRRQIRILASLLLASLELLRLGASNCAGCTAGWVGAASKGEAGFFWIASKKQSRRSSEEAGGRALQCHRRPAHHGPSRRLPEP
jgi:hypothetical protein